MSTAVPIAASLALGTAAVAAFCDHRRGEIPNWLTLPPLVLAPLVYGLVFGLEHALHSCGAALLAGLVPYFLFRRSAMGGGDVKLFASLGAIMGFDLLAGLEIQLSAFAFATLAAGAALAWRGRLLATLGGALAAGLEPLLPSRLHRERCAELSTPIRMGGSILAATSVFAAPHLLLVWGAP
jgi:prepilin peptidase CpaA